MKSTPDTSRSAGLALALTALAGLAFLLIDLAWQGSAVTPLLALCWLMAIPMVRGPGGMRRMALILFAFVVASLWRHGWDRVMVRGTGFLLGSWIAWRHALSRERANRLVDQLNLIVKRAPAALVTADGMGCILSASEEIEALAGDEFRPLEGHSFSDVLMGDEPPGEAMRKYLEWFRADGTHEQEFRLRGDRNLRFHGRVVCTGEGRDRLLIASLEPLKGEKP